MLFFFIMFIFTTAIISFRSTYALHSVKEGIDKKCAVDVYWIFLGNCRPLPTNENDVYAISARGIAGQKNYQNDPGYYTQGSGYNHRYKLSNISKLYTNCPNDIAIIVHGYDNNNNEALEKFDRAKNSLDVDRYKIPVVGFSWESNPTVNTAENWFWDTLAKAAGSWVIAKSNADQSGINLAKFIFDFKNNCEMTDIRIVAHSLGTRVVESAIVTLDNNIEWKNSHFKIHSIHFLGAAIYNNEIERNGPFGHAIENQVDQFYNLYSPTDRILDQIFTLAEQGKPRALGQELNQQIQKPGNYIDINVQDEIPPFIDADGDGDCDHKFPLPGYYCSKVDCSFVLGMLHCGADVNNLNRGDNHFGYWGFRDARSGGFRDDGAMNIVTGSYRDNPPIADAGNDLRAAESTLVTLDGSNSKDVDINDIIKYNWKQISPTSPQSVIYDSSYAKAFAYIPYVNNELDKPDTTFIFELTVTDLKNDISKDTVSVIVRSPVDIWGFDRIGTNSPDELYGSAGKNLIQGLEGDDVITGGNGSDIIMGDSGNDILQGSGGDDIIKGGAGKDTLWGFRGNDYLSGGEGDDELWGEEGSDHFECGKGIDIVKEYNQTEKDTFEEDCEKVYSKQLDQFGSYISKLTKINKFSTIDFIGNRSKNSINGTDSKDFIRGYGNADVIWGLGGNDVLLGDEGNDTIYGLSGNDIVKGDAGNDYLEGDAGNDYISGGQGNDVLFGDLGSDHFECGEGIDWILNYNKNEGDTKEEDCEYFA